MSVTNKHIQLLRKTDFVTVEAAKAGLEAAFTGTTIYEGEAAIAVTTSGEVVLGIKSATSGSTFYNAASVDAFIAALNNKIGVLSSLNTDTKDSIVAAINSLKAGNIAYVTGSTDTVVSGATNVDEAIKAIDTAIKNMKAGEAEYTIAEVTENVPATVLHRFQLSKTVGSSTEKAGEYIDINKDSSLVSIDYIDDPADAHYQNLEYVYIDASGNTQTTYVDMSELVLEAEFASGVTVTNHVVHGVVDDTSESFLTVGSDGFKLSGVQTAIDTAEAAAKAYTDTKVAGLDATATQTAGDDGLALSITEVDGKITAISGSIAANTYDAHGAAATAETNAKSYTDTQISGLDADVTSTGGSKVTVAVAEESGVITAVTVTESDIASANALSTEVAARKAVTGQNGDTYTANASTNYISGATSMNNADVLLDTKVKANADAIAALQNAKVSVVKANDSENFLTVTENSGKTVYTIKIDGVQTAIDTAVSGAVETLDAEAVGGTGKYLTTISESNGIISATAADLNAAAVAATPITAGNDTVDVTGTTVEAQIASLAETAKDIQDAAYSGVTAGNGIAVTSQTNGHEVAVKFKATGVTADLFDFDSNGAIEFSDTFDCGTWT